MPTGVVQHIDHVQPGNIEALQVADQRQQHADRPDRNAGQQPGNEAAPVGGRPVQHRQHARQELQGRNEGDDTQIGQVLLSAEHEVEAVTQRDDRHDQSASRPLQPAIDIALGGWLIKRQHQVIEGHAGQRQRGDDDQPAGRRQPADVGEQSQGLAVGGDTDAEREVFRAGGGAQL